FHKNGVWLAGIRPLKTETKSEVNFFNIILFLMVNSMCFLGSRPLCHSWFTITDNLPPVVNAGKQLGINIFYSV
ncbi:MAG: hypothetical protein CDV28_1301, partial [Candidatus Electronema aureum]